MFERVKTLTNISLLKKKPYILISTPSAFAQQVPPLESFSKSMLKIKVGENLRRDVLIRYLFDAGFEEATLVEETGFFARRGGIIDIYTLDSDFPIRVEFTANKINSLRKFETGTQLSFEKVESLNLIPLNEFFVDKNKIDLYSQFKKSISFVVEPERVSASHQIKQLLSKGVINNSWLQDIFTNSTIFQNNISKYAFGRKIYNFNVFDVENRFQLNPTFIWNRVKKEKVFIFSGTKGQEEKIREVLKEKKVSISKNSFLDRVVSEGFSVPDINITILSKDQLFSRHSKRYPPLRKNREYIPLFGYSEIREGDHIVHQNEGIGVFEGMKKIVSGENQKEEYIIIRYEGGDKLYVPVRNISLVHKYIGEKDPKLSKLNTKSWLKVKEKVKSGIRDLASDLYKLYATRKIEEGFAFESDKELQQQFDESFAYKETEDQLKAINEVRQDMSSSKIMDRIVCGDAGYGKTEVAIRASFKAVLSGKQVVILVPTTVLALQHFLIFKERFADFPVTIEMVSRLVGVSEQKKIVKNISEGFIDIVIGTHRLLQKDIKFKNLGLLIVDEEQRFGVMHKERIRAMFKKVDVLTLTATPIPRTLYMALSGMKDISVIKTPPQGRVSVVTYVGRYNERLVKEALQREIDRGGQVFYLHNFIYDIEKVRKKLQNMLPSAIIETAHGRMNPEKLSDIMKRFADGQIDVLVATTIVESGIDIPKANTLIVDNAHRYGLADLYQLRGRVGRYKWRAYAYFLIPHHVFVTQTAKERLQALQELNKPGSGYRIALKDLEIRGAGNILGKEQHGFIDKVGFNLYCQFWQEITREQESIDTKKEVEVPSSLIPDEYISNPALRFYVYKKLASLQTKEETNLFLEELTDRFGVPPAELKGFLKDTFL